MRPEKVGQKKGESKSLFCYKHIIYDIDGWVDAKKYLPLDFDLVYIRVKGRKDQMGWHSTNMWDGLDLKKTDEVLFWKKRFDEED